LILKSIYICVCFPSQTSVLDIKGNLRVHIDILFIKDIRTKFVTTYMCICNERFLCDVNITYCKPIVYTLFLLSQ